MRLSVYTIVERLLPKRASRWLGYALTSTVLIVVGGSLLMWGLFRSQAVILGAADGGDQQVITVLIDRTPGGPSQWTPYIAVLKQVQEQMRVPVQAKYVAGRAAVADAIEESEVDAAFISIHQFVSLPEDTKYELLATPVVDGRTHDTAVIVVDADSPYETFDDLYGARIALAPGASTRGFAYANYLVNQSGRTLDEYFSEVQVAGEHVENLELLESGVVDAASVGRSHLFGWPVDAFRIVAESPEMGLPPLVISTQLPQYFRDNLREALSRMGPGVGLPVDGLVEGFYFPTPDDYRFALILDEYTDASTAEQVWGESR